MFVTDPGFEFFHPGSRIRIRIKEFLVFKTKKTFFKLSEKWYVMFILVPDPDFFPTGSGSRTQGQESSGSATLPGPLSFDLNPDP
jgi:hypothetical protein